MRLSEKELNIALNVELVPCVIYMKNASTATVLLFTIFHTAICKCPSSGQFYIKEALFMSSKNC